MATLGKRFANADMLDQAQNVTASATISPGIPLVLIGTGNGVAATVTLPDPGECIGQTILLLVASLSGTITIAPPTGVGIIYREAAVTTRTITAGASSVGTYVLMTSVGANWAILSCLSTYMTLT